MRNRRCSCYCAVPARTLPTRPAVGGDGELIRKPGNSCSNDRHMRTSWLPPFIAFVTASPLVIAVFVMGTLNTFPDTTPGQSATQDRQKQSLRTHPYLGTIYAQAHAFLSAFHILVQAVARLQVCQWQAIRYKRLHANGGGAEWDWHDKSLYQAKLFRLFLRCSLVYFLLGNPELVHHKTHYMTMLLRILILLGITVSSSLAGEPSTLQLVTIDAPLDSIAKATSITIPSLETARDSTTATGATSISAILSRSQTVALMAALGTQAQKVDMQKEGFTATAVPDGKDPESFHMSLLVARSPEKGEQTWDMGDCGGVLFVYKDRASSSGTRFYLLHFE